MTVRFLLITPANNNLIIDTADCPEDLDFDKAHSSPEWRVYVAHTDDPDANGPIHCIARVNLEGSPTFDNDFEYAVREVYDDLKLRNEYGEFDDTEYLSDGPVVDIGYEQPCCGGCASGDCCGGDSSCACGG